jgi:two-component Ni(II)/redox sensor kinase NrsS
MAPLLEAYRRQEQFSADVAHELRTPLANLLALLEAERSGLSRSITPFQAGVRTPAPPKAEAPSATGLDRMLSQGRRLQRLIADLLLLASLERPAHRRHLQQCNLAEICADVLEDFSEAAAAATVTLEAAIDVCPATMKLAGALHRYTSYQPSVVASKAEIGCRGVEPPLTSGRRRPWQPATIAKLVDWPWRQPVGAMGCSAPEGNGGSSMSCRSSRDITASLCCGS